jgi:hypothetical protein
LKDSELASQPGRDLHADQYTIAGKTGVNHAMTQPRGNDQNDSLVLKEQHDRLQVLVGELLEENQKLRFKLSHLEQQAKSAERGLEEATRWSGALF